MSKKTYELRDKSVGFYDQETGAQVVGDGTLEIGPNDRVGRKTHRVIKAGGLIEVNRTSKAASTTEAVNEGATEAKKPARQKKPAGKK